MFSEHLDKKVNWSGLVSTVGGAERETGRGGGGGQGEGGGGGGGRHMEKEGRDVVTVGYSRTFQEKGGQFINYWTGCAIKRSW